ncbi:MAG TPA: DUF58 domain-containing protein, partial [Methylomirabilota bacterium]|nr:DUF58 domain-containing protein [Methylomirabilota bacterium]
MAGGESPAVYPWYGRWLFPQRTIRPTRDGWWCLFAALGLGVAAVNTGNNLAYLLCSMLLAIITVSGILSDQSLRGVRVLPVMPDEVYAGRPALFGATAINGKRRLPSYSIAVEILGPGDRGRVRKRPVRRTLYLPRLGPRVERLVTWEATLPGRGRRRLPGLRLTTRFPFGLFVKMGPVHLESEVLVFPAVRAIDADRLRELGGHGDTAARRRGRGHDLYDLRPYRPGDDPRLIHWRASAKVGALTVRELEEDAALDTRLLLDGPGTDPVRLEEGLSEAASLAVHLIRTGAGVEVIAPGLWVPRGH